VAEDVLAPGGDARTPKEAVDEAIARIKQILSE
jgi:hypothetical protein